MLKKHHSIPCLCFMAFLLVACGPSEAERRATNDCDVQAANPNDEQRVAPGASSTAIIPKLAVEACEKAVKSLPNEPRLLYQLGRAYDAAGRSADAIKAYQRAMDKNHAMAFYNMGLKAQETGDEKGALALFKKGAERGSALAMREVAKSTFTSEGFSSPAFFQSIYDEKFPRRDNGLVIYISTFIDLFNNTEGCRNVATNTLKIYASQMVQGAVYGQLFDALKQSKSAGTLGFNEGRDAAQGMAMQAGRAEADANLFYSRYGCDGVVAKRFFRNIARWLDMP